MNEDYISKNSETVINLVMRVAALERLLIDTGIITEEQLNKNVQDMYNELVEKLKESGVSV